MARTTTKKISKKRTALKGQTKTVGARGRAKKVVTARGVRRKATGTHARAI
jgi:hypothetical protein